MADSQAFELQPIGFVRSSLKRRQDAPRQGSEGAPQASIELDPRLADAVRGLSPGDAVIVITWFHQSRRDVLQVHPRDDESVPLAGVFATRSPERPNPLGLHRVRLLEVDGHTLRVEPLEAIDGTPVVDIKPVLSDSSDW